MYLSVRYHDNRDFHKTMAPWLWKKEIESIINSQMPVQKRKKNRKISHTQKKKVIYTQDSSA